MGSWASYRLGIVPDQTSTLIPPRASPQAPPAQASAPVRVSRVPSFSAPRGLLKDSFFSNLRDFFFERPVKVYGRPGAPFTQTTFGGGLGENLKEFLRSAPALPKDAPTSGLAVRWDAGFGSFGQRLRELFFPTKLPPLPFAVKPVKVKDIWSKDEKFGWTQAISIAMHGLVIALLMVPIASRVTATIQAKPAYNVTDISPYAFKTPPGGTKPHGGGGGGDRSELAPTKGRAPKFSWTQFTPPMATIRNQNPKLAMDPTLLGDPAMKIMSPPLTNYGDPLAASVNYSGGPGGGGGIGTGCCGGIGSGEGGGLGPGTGGGTGGGVFQAGRNGVGTPACLYCPDPQYSDEARKAKYQGIVVLNVIITADGRATNIRVAKGVGMGLEEKAIEAVRGWRFKPALFNGKAVPVEVPIEVTFRLL
jgi:periplasmic protein TonB